MLSRVVKEHQDKQALFREQQEKRRKAALAAVHKCTGTMVDSLNSGVEKAYENQRKLDREAKALQVCRVWCDVTGNWSLGMRQRPSIMLA